MDRSVGSLWTQSVVGVRGPGVKEKGKGTLFKCLIVLALEH